MNDGGVGSDKHGPRHVAKQPGFWDDASELQGVSFKTLVIFSKHVILNLEVAFLLKKCICWA